ncbi:MAG: tetratricopeptide repeat protein [Chloroflexota bacterium]
MAYQEDEKVRLRRRFTQQAIDLAMQGRWRDAVAINRSLLTSFAGDVDAYNRLGRASMEIGDYTEAREAYQRALELDPYNVIARKNLSRLSRLNGVAVATEEAFHKVEPHNFIEETGKAGVVNLYRLGPDAVLAGVVAGDPVELKIEGMSLFILSSRKEYIGELEPKHAHRLIKLMKGGNRYNANIISSYGTVTVIIREIYQDPGQVGHLSFPPKAFERLRPYVGDRLFRRETEYDEDEYGYAIEGSDEMDLLREDPGGLKDKIDNEV